MNKKYVKKLLSMAMVFSLAVASLAACSEAEAAVNGVKDSLAGNSMGAQAAVNAAPITLVNKDEMFTERDLSGEYNESESIGITLDGNSAQCDFTGVSIADNTVTITAEGIYVLSGTLQNGMIVVDVADTEKVQLVLDGVEIANSCNAAIYVKSADKVFVTTAKGSVNKLSNGGSYTVLDDNQIDGVVFAKSDLVLNGEGDLEIAAAEGHGIVSKDDVKVTGGNVVISAPGHGISGKDSVRVAAGSISINAVKDGIQADNEEDTEKGYVYLLNGVFEITAGGDGISASNFVQVEAGEYVITTGGGSANNSVAKDENGEAISAKGFKAESELILNDGKFTIDSQDDALHSDLKLTVNGGEYMISTGDDGLHAEDTAAIAGGNINISTSYEGIEGNYIVITGGLIKMNADDDGINAAGGADQSGFGGMYDRGGFGGGMGGFGEATDSSVQISGGVIYMNANGDGLDSNGSLLVSGGEVYISGSSNGGNGAFDYTGSGQITGGIVVAVGNSQMAMNFDSSSTQGSALLTTSNQSAGTSVTLKNAEGKALVSYTAENSFNSIVVSCPDMVQGGTYIVCAGESETEFTLDSLIYGTGFGMGGFGGGGMGGFDGGRGGRGDRNNGNMNGQNTAPEMPNGEMPEMPNGEPPQMPNGEPPQMPNGEMPGGWMPNDGQRPQETEGSSSNGSI